MTDEQTLVAEASDRHTTLSRLHELSVHSSAAVRVAAMSNLSFPTREWADRVCANDPDLAESALDAVIARGSEFQNVVWDVREALALVPIRLSETLNGRHVVSDNAFEAFMRGWKPAMAETITFGSTDRREILSLYLREEDPEDDE